jgi:hypothetical protein
MTSRLVGLVGVAALAVDWLPVTSTAAPRVTTAAACRVSVGSVTAGGTNMMRAIVASSPPAAGSEVMGSDLYPDGQVRLSGPMNFRFNAGGYEITGHVVLGDVMYSGYYVSDYDTGGVASSSLTRVGPGWSNFVAFDESTLSGPANTYGLRADGVLFRWTLDGHGVWKSKTSSPGFAAVKSMALISQTRTYDTFLANTRGGALYTIHIPNTSPMRPIVKLVRRSTWQVFDALVAQRCGPSGTLVAAIDKDTKTGYLYSVGHGNGLATAIQNLGKVDTPLEDPVFFDWTNDNDTITPPFGE